MSVILTAHEEPFPLPH